jgi:hypothetical protein
MSNAVDTIPCFDQLKQNSDNRKRIWDDNVTTELTTNEAIIKVTHLKTILIPVD